MAERVKFATSEADLERIKRQAEETARAEMSKMLEDKNASVEERERVARRWRRRRWSSTLQMSVAQSDRGGRRR